MTREVITTDYGWRRRRREGVELGIITTVSYIILKRDVIKTLANLQFQTILQ